MPPSSHGSTPTRPCSMCVRAPPTRPCCSSPPRTIRASRHGSRASLPRRCRRPTPRPGRSCSSHAAEKGMASLLRSVSAWATRLRSLAFSRKSWAWRQRLRHPHRLTKLRSEGGSAYGCHELNVGVRPEIEAQQSRKMKLQTRELHPGAEHERVVEAADEAVGYHAIIAIHSTKLGPAIAGTRAWPYASF